MVGLVNDGHFFVNRSARYDKPGAKDNWRLPPGTLRDERDRVLAVIKDVAAALKASTTLTRRAT